MSDKWVRTETGAMQRVAKPAAVTTPKKKKEQGFIDNILDFYHGYQKGKSRLLDSLGSEVAKPKGK